MNWWTIVKQGRILTLPRTQLRIKKPAKAEPEDDCKTWLIELCRLIDEELMELQSSDYNYFEGWNYKHPDKLTETYACKVKDAIQQPLQNEYYTMDKVASWPQRAFSGKWADNNKDDKLKGAWVTDAGFRIEINDKFFSFGLHQQNPLLIFSCGIVFCDYSELPNYNYFSMHDLPDRTSPELLELTLEQHVKFEPAIAKIAAHINNNQLLTEYKSSMKDWLHFLDRKVTDKKNGKDTSYRQYE